MVAIAFSLGAICAVLGTWQVLSHKGDVPFVVRLVSLLLGVLPGAAAARLALAHQLPEAFFLDALAILLLIVVVRLVARAHGAGYVEGARQ